MDFDFTEDQESLRDAVRRWVDKGFPFERRHQLARSGGAKGRMGRDEGSTVSVVLAWDLVSFWSSFACPLPLSWRFNASAKPPSWPVNWESALMRATVLIMKTYAKSRL